MFQRGCDVYCLFCRSWNERLCPTCSGTSDWDYQQTISKNLAGKTQVHFISNSYILWKNAGSWDLLHLGSLNMCFCIRSFEYHQIFLSLFFIHYRFQDRKPISSIVINSFKHLSGQFMSCLLGWRINNLCYFYMGHLSNLGRKKVILLKQKIKPSLKLFGHLELVSTRREIGSQIYSNPW